MSTDQDKLFDARLIRHHLRRQVLDDATVQKHLESLQDDAAHGQATDTRFVDNHGRDDEDED